MSFNLVAHRGYAAKYPENTIPAVKACLDVGCKFVEIDIQLSADLTPYLLHDISFKRTANVDKCIFDLQDEVIDKINVCEPDRFEQQFNPTPVTSLHSFVEFINNYEDAICFIEIKEESILRFGLETTAEKIIDALQPNIKQFVIISYDLDILQYCKRKHRTPTGWVMKTWNNTLLNTAKTSNLDYIICNYKKIPADINYLPDFNAFWMCYEIEDIDTANHLNKIGVTHIETMLLPDLIPLTGNKKIETI